MSDEDLKNLCETWQERLRLKDWDIDVRFVDSAEIDNNQGQCRVFRDEKMAVVKVLKPEGFNRTDDYYKAFPEAHKTEYILVHELLHIPLDGLMTKEPAEHEHIAQEQAINQMARALYRAYRG